MINLCKEMAEINKIIKCRTIFNSPQGKHMQSKFNKEHQHKAEENNQENYNINM